MRYILSFIMVLGLLGCGVMCPKEPPRYAKFIEGGGYGMAYHFSLFYPQGDAGHTPSLRCTKYEYSKYDIYMDDLGTINGDSILWFFVRGEDTYFNSIKKKATFVISKDKIVISGLYDGNEYLNGTYSVR